MAKVAKRRGRYVLDFYDHAGIRRRETMPEGTTKKRALEELRTREEQIARGTYLPEKKVPLFSEVAQDWIEHKKEKLRANTWEVYEGHVRNHFKDAHRQAHPAQPPCQYTTPCCRALAPESWPSV